MRIDLSPSETWTSLSDQYRAVLAAKLPVFSEPGLQVQAYMGYSHAVWEITQSLAKLFSHKKTIAIVGKGDLLFDPIAAAFIEEGYNVKSLTGEEVENPASWLDSVQTELLFVLYTHDDPVTGRIHNNDALLGALKEKRIFRIATMHAGFHYGTFDRPAPFEVRILSLSPDRALVVAGERCRVLPPVVSRLPWKPVSRETAERELFTDTDLKTKVIEFESQLPEGFRPYFKADERRVYDRAVFYSPEFDGSAVIDEVARMMGITTTEAGQESKLESTSPCRWVNPRISEWLARRGEAAEVIRGLVLIDARELSPGLNAQLAKAAQTLRKLQTGN